MSNSIKDNLLRIRDLVKDVDGFLTNREGQALYKLASACRNGVIVEIGSWKGKSTIWLGQGAREAGAKTIYAIDHHVGSQEHQGAGGAVWTFKEFENNIRKAGLDDVVTPLVKTSAEARPLVNDPIDLLFIDGAHDYDSVQQDFRLWFPAVRNQGTIAFHDTPWPGVGQVVSEVLKTGQFCRAYFSDTLFFLTKTDQANIFDKICNRVMFHLSRSFYAVNASSRPKWLRTFQKDVIKLFRFIFNPRPFVNRKKPA
ncbi:MAG TPA: class I SAM-dependent methyltransferase [Candidatus Omnitrophota bacterium]|nr:class I SAM-dependent methyltransferase [Candidatus Omnitrophota bacterium]HQO59143.1 class I SAM-dependent methyltransferase [Candidatus Omnitrophota bacterium]HQP12223.1 class I SAM-dependent methyltransferase [Candidatus Omnitrophota bacterium]